jgi:predicted Holliday junction resolvase-like endonuclease
MVRGNLRAMVWIFLIFILVVVLIYIVSEHTMQVRRRKQQLEQIQKRLAEKKGTEQDDASPES